MQPSHDSLLAPSAPRRGTVVIALGNPQLADDGLGQEVLARLASTYDVGPEVSLEVVGADDGRELPVVERAEHVLYIDAIRAVAAPGTVVRLEGADVSSRGTLPPEAVALGIVPAVLMPRKGLTGCVSARVDDLLDAIVAQLRSWGHDVRVVQFRNRSSPFPDPVRR